MLRPAGEALAWSCGPLASLRRKDDELTFNSADIRYIQAILGHAELSTTQVYTQVSIRQLKAIHTATHPGRMPGTAGAQNAADVPSPPHGLLNAAAALLMALDAEAEEEVDDVAADALRHR